MKILAIISSFSKSDDIEIYLYPKWEGLNPHQIKTSFRSFTNIRKVIEI